MSVVGGGGGGCGLVATATVIFVCLFNISINRSFYDLAGDEPAGPTSIDNTLSFRLLIKCVYA